LQQKSSPFWKENCSSTILRFFGWIRNYSWKTDEVQYDLEEIQSLTAKSIFYVST
jgi:hypothetical protein